LAQAFDAMNAEDARVPLAVAAAKDSVVAATELVAAALARGGRLLYVGAGTSGRLGVLDASECPPTFRTDPSQVVGVIAGGQIALTSAVEGAEDDAGAGAAAMDERRVGPLDVVFGIAAGGTTPYVHGAIARAKELGARTVFFACVPKEQCADAADVSIRVLVGPEVLAGSTRLKSGTATKLVLNMVTTLAMTRLGKVHGNLMVDVVATANKKLWQRGIALVSRLTGLAHADAEALLRSAGGHVKTAAAMHRLGCDKPAAEAALRRADGFLRRLAH
ncbi:MAG: N-acetylmuramic acid 6-phosphate etherase, partial [Planctomycetota bacterium]